MNETIFQLFSNQWASFPVENVSRPIKILFYKWCPLNGLQNISLVWPLWNAQVTNAGYLVEGPCNVKGAVSGNSAKLGNYKVPVKLRET